MGNNLLKMKLTTKLAFLMFVIFSIMVSIANAKKSHKVRKNKSHKSRVLPVLTPMATYITDKTSIWNVESTVNLLINLSKEITKPEIVAGKVSKQYQDVQGDCLGNLKNLGGKWGNNMRYFWNIVTDYYKSNPKNDKAVVEKTFEEGFSMCAEQAATGAFAGKKCSAVFVMAFDAAKAKKVIEEFLKKFNLVPPKTPLITSFIGTHRNIAPPGFFKKMNRDRRRRRR